MASESSDPLIAWLEVLIKLAKQPYLYIATTRSTLRMSAQSLEVLSHSVCIPLP
jgi:hypothetical protein